jgi:hypothetical protein
MSDMTGFGLQEEQEVAIFLRFLIVGKEAFLKVGGIFQVICNFILLLHPLASRSIRSGCNAPHLFQRHPVLDQ